MVEWMNEWIHSLIRSFIHWCKVSPAELESVLRLHPDVVDAAVDSVRDDVDGDLPRALVVPRSPDIRLSDVISFVNGSYRTHSNNDMQIPGSWFIPRQRRTGRHDSCSSSWRDRVAQCVFYAGWTEPGICKLIHLKPKKWSLALLLRSICHFWPHQVQLNASPHSNYWRFTLTQTSKTALFLEAA